MASACKRTDPRAAETRGTSIPSSSGSATPTIDAVPTDSPWGDDPAVAGADAEVADQILADGGGGFIVTGRTTRGTTTVNWLRRYLPSGELDRPFLAKAGAEAAIHGWKPMRFGGVLPTGDARFVTDDRGELAVTPGGDWRRLAATTPTKQPELWLRIHGSDLAVWDGSERTPIARGSLGTVLRPEESLEAIGGTEVPDVFRVTLGANYFLLESGKEKYEHWRSAVGADDFAMLPPGQKQSAFAASHPDPPMRYGLVQVLITPGEDIVTRRIALSVPPATGPGVNPAAVVDDFNANKVAQSAAGDIVLQEDEGQLHQTGPQRVAVYWLTVGPKTSSNAARAPVAVFEGRPFVTASTFFDAGSHAPSLCFVLAEEKALRIFVSDPVVAKQVAEVTLQPGGAASASMFVTAHSFARYMNDQPGRVASSRVTITTF